MGTFAGPAIVMNGLVVYIDAANIKSYSGSGLTVDGLIGGIGGSFQDTEKFTGRIAQVLFYNKELTAAEIRQNYHATKKRYGL
jgi:hypothetical protein